MDRRTPLQTPTKDFTRIYPSMVCKPRQIRSVLILFSFSRFVLGFLLLVFLLFFLHVVLQPMSIITPFMQDNTRNFHTSSPKSAPSNPPIRLPNPKWLYRNYPRFVQRHQSFHGFANNPTNQNVHFSGNFIQRPPPPILSNFPPAYKVDHFNSMLPMHKNFSVSNIHIQNVPQTRVLGRKEQQKQHHPQQVTPKAEDQNLKNSAYEEVNKEAKVMKKIDLKEKKFGSLELKKHKCYSPTFYSMRCKKHAKKRPVVYAVPTKPKTDLQEKIDGEPSEAGVFVFRGDQEAPFENLTDSIQIMEQNSENARQEEAAPKPAPRCKRHRKNSCHVYENVSMVKDNENADSSNNSSENGVEVSVTEALIHNSSPNAVSKDEKEKRGVVNPNFKRSPTVRVTPRLVKPNGVSPRGALNTQLQAKLKAIPVDDQRPKPAEKFQVPEMPLLDTQNKLTSKLSNTKQVCFCV